MTNPVGISNDIMAAAPGDAYLGYAVRRLRHWNRWMGIKYIQASSAAAKAAASCSLLHGCFAALSGGSELARCFPL